MKKIFLVWVMGLALILSGGMASADTFSDDYANWPGWPKSPNPINPADQIGTYPTVSGATINISGNYLQSIVFDITNLRFTETVFINTNWVKGTPYEGWDYFIGYGLAPKLYAVSPGFDYTLISNPDWRLGHPFGIQSNYLTEDNTGILTGVTFLNDKLTYSFAANRIRLFEGENSYVVGLSEDCGNDVFLTPVPEGMTLILLGAGLAGIAGLRRKAKK